MKWLTYDEWLRYEDAVRVTTSLDPNYLVDWNRDSNTALARALGVDKRRNMKWDWKSDHEPYPSGEYHYIGEKRVFCFLGGDGWQVMLETTLVVMRFPTKESALNCFERLLGRAEYDDLFSPEELERSTGLMGEAEFLQSDPHMAGLVAVWGSIERNNPSKLAGSAGAEVVLAYVRALAESASNNVFSDDEARTLGSTIMDVIDGKGVLPNE